MCAECGGCTALWTLKESYDIHQVFYLTAELGVHAYMYYTNQPDLIFHGPFCPEVPVMKCP